MAAINLTVELDDNKLVCQEDLESESEPDKVPKNLWSDPDCLNKLQQEMQLLSKVRISTEKIDDKVLIMAMGEVLATVDWENYTKFSQAIERILNSPFRIPFTTKTYGKLSGKMDFWLINVFINANDHYEHNGKKYNKRDVLMSREFYSCLNNFCIDILKDEVQFWTFTGSYSGKRHLELSKLHPNDRNALPQKDANDLVMIKFKRKTPEIMVGCFMPVQ
jgi:hypothetical protein